MRNILFLVMVLFFAVACKNDKSASTVNSPEKKVVVDGEKPIMGTKNYWKKVQKRLKITDEMTASLKAVDDKFVRLIKKEVKANKWEGDANKANREALENRRKSQTKKVLGNKAYKKFLKVNESFRETRY